MDRVSPLALSPIPSLVYNCLPPPTSMASSRTVLHVVIALSLACGLSWAAPAGDPRASTNSNAASKQRGSGSKLLYADGVDVVDSMHAFLATLSELEEVQAGEGAREEEVSLRREFLDFFRRTFKKSKTL